MKHKENSNKTNTTNDFDENVNILSTVAEDQQTVNKNISFLEDKITSHLLLLFGNFIMLQNVINILDISFIRKIKQGVEIERDLYLTHKISQLNKNKGMSREGAIDSSIIEEAIQSYEQLFNKTVKSNSKSNIEKIDVLKKHILNKNKDEFINIGSWENLDRKLQNIKNHVKKIQK